MNNDILMVMWTKEQRNAWQRAYRITNGNSNTHKYERTINGFLMRKYRNMQSRVLGIQKIKAHLYKNKSLLSREDFYTWAVNQDSFHKLWAVWINSNHDRKLCPSVDRIDSSKGYTLKNMEWVTHSENSSRGSISRNKLKI
jgi:hypothetical protein